MQDVIDHQIVLLLETRVRDTGHHGELLVRVRQALEKLEQIDAIHAAVQLPIMIDSRVPASIKKEDLVARGARIQLQGRQPIAATVKALHETYTHLFNGGAPADLKSKIASEQEMANLVDNENYKKWQREYLR